MEKMAERHNIPLQMYKVQRMQNPCEGSWTSHRNLIQHSYDCGLNHILIFEDDAEETKHHQNKDIWNECITFMRTNTEWDLFYLGWCPGHPINDASKFYKCLLGSKIRPYNYIYECTCFCQHAYAVSRKGMRRFLQALPRFNGIQMDIEILTKDLNLYMCSPMLFDQRWCLENSKSTVPVKTECKLSRIMSIADASSFTLMYIKVFLVFLCVLVFVYILYHARKPGR
jgi:GR25 family glycosyltransferase involved in LPS biosynthesis